MLIFDQTASSVTEDDLPVHDVAIQDESSPSPSRKGKQKALSQATSASSDTTTATFETALDDSSVDWTQYDAPKVLWHIGGIDIDIPDSDVATVQQIIRESIERINTRIREEEEQKRLVANGKSEKGKGKEREGRLSQEDEGVGVNRPEETVDGSRQGDEDSTQHDGDDELQQQPPNGDQYPLSSKETSIEDIPTELPKRPRIRTLMNLVWKVSNNSGGGTEHGESSTIGAACHKILTYSAQMELRTLSAKKKFVSDLIKKAMGEDTSSASPGSSIQEAEV